ncbi:MAG: hypothetical protein JST46_10500 [Bacteroidetes bacterium]|nr:hypothetical protein [Bacteroidota bacterium]
MKFLRTIRFSLLLSAALTPFFCALISGSKYFELATIPSVWIVLSVPVLALKLVTDALAAARRKITPASAESTPPPSPPTFVEEVTGLVWVGDYFTLAIGLLPAVLIYFILMLEEYRGAAYGYILVPSLVVTAFWLRWLEKRGHATVILPLVPIKLYHVVLVGIVLALLGTLRELFFA